MWTSAAQLIKNASFIKLLISVSLCIFHNACKHLCRCDVKPLLFGEQFLCFVWYIGEAVASPEEDS